MSGDPTRSERDYDQPRVPAALRDRIEQLFVECRGYEPATFQESLSLVADLAAARIDEDGSIDAVSADAESSADVGAAEASVATANDGAPDASAATADTASATSDSADGGTSVSHVRADVVDDATEESFVELEPGDRDDSDQSSDSGSSALVRDDGVPESLRADPESNCALCGDVHPVSVLQTTILDGAGSVALVCPDCAE